MRYPIIFMRFATLLSIISLISTAHAAHFNPEGTPALMGSGFNTIGSSVLGDCVDSNVLRTTIYPQNSTDSTGLNGPVTRTSDPHAVSVTRINEEGQSVTYTASEITSLSRFREVTNISASASFSYGIYSGGGKFSYFDDQSMDSFSSYLYISILVNNQTDVLSKKNITLPAIQSYVSGSDQFRKKCGDEFVAAVTTGGIFQAIVRFETSSAEHQNEVSAAISGAIAGFGSASGSFSQSLATLNKLAKSTIMIVRKGSSGSIPNLSELNDYAISFPSKVSKLHGQPYAFDAITLPYTVADNLPVGATPYVYEKQNIYLEGLAALRDGALQVRNNLLYAIAHPDEFSDADINYAMSNLGVQNTFFDAVVKAASDCYLDPLTNCSSIYPTAPTIRAPVRANSAAGKLIDQAEDLYKKRGNRQLADAALAFLNTADLSGASLSERYHAELLRSELLSWKLTQGFPGGSDSQEYKNISISLGQSIGRAEGLSEALPSHPCEADYLSAVYYISQDPGVSETNYRNQIALLNTLGNRFTREGHQCNQYDFHGVEAYRGWAELLLSNKAGIADTAALKEAGVKDAEAAYNGEPNWPFNFVVYTGSKNTSKARCDVAKTFANTKTPASMVDIEPVYSEIKRGILFMYALGCATSP